MTRLRMALLNASHTAQNTRRNFRREVDADLVEFDLLDGDLPPSFEYDACLVTGSRCSVYWDEDWIPGAREWLAEAVDRGMPALGICFGHQLLADALGGSVADMGEYELGYRTVEHDGSRLFEGVDESFLVFTSHSDAVVELPDGAEEIASNDYGVHGFRMGHAFGVQSHPEYDAETAELVTRAKDLPDERIRSVLDGITDANVDEAAGSKQVFENFCRYVRDVRDLPAAPARAESDD